MSSQDAKKVSDSFQNLIEALPVLPGTKFNLKRLENYRKSHVFNYKNGVAVINDECSGIGGQPLPQVEKTEKPVTSADLLSQQSAKISGECSLNIQPTWIAFDRKVLRFDAYFKEELAITDSSSIPHRIRKATIYFYLEDDSIHVSQPAEYANGGVGVGTLIRRHRIAVNPNGSGQHFTVANFNVGNNVTFYGKDFTITGCDKFTREFLSDLSVNVPQNTEAPEDPYYARVKSLKQLAKKDREVV